MAQHHQRSTITPKLASLAFTPALLQWLAGLEPPSYQEVGPYVFSAHEAHYQLEWTLNWEEVAWTYHQWQTFVPDLSCANCTMQDNIIGINRWGRAAAAGQGVVKRKARQGVAG